MIYSKSFRSSSSQNKASDYQRHPNTNLNNNEEKNSCSSSCSHCSKLEDLLLKVSRKYERMKNENHAENLSLLHLKTKNKEAKQQNNRLKDSQLHEKENYIQPPKTKLVRNKSIEFLNLTPTALKIMLAKLNTEIEPENCSNFQEKYKQGQEKQNSSFNKKTFKLEDFKKKINDNENDSTKVKRRKSSVALRKEEFLIYE